MESNNNNFKIEMSEWRGYSEKAISNIEKTLERIENRVDSIDKRLNKFQWKIAATGGAVAVIVALITSMVVNVFN